jgi:hypothetical protein
MLNKEAQGCLYHLSTIGRSLKAIADLLVPEPDLHAVDREGLACLMDVLHREYDKAYAALVDALQNP